MQEKIDWYQEVVDLEPTSKLFFPLAKMVAENDVPRAVDTLQRGLEKHPEFIEARLYFIELLHNNKDKEDYGARLKTQLSVLSPMLMRYAGFWQAWGGSFMEEGQELSSNDKGLAVAFMGAMFENKNISLTDIFSAGLQAVMGSEANFIKPCAAPTSPSVTKNPPSISKKPTLVLKNVSQSIVKPLAVSEADNSEADNDDNEEQFSLRTRSMAEVLAEQGDYSSALEIYQELLQASDSEEEKQDLQSRMATLQGMSGAHQGTDSRLAAKDTPSAVATSPTDASKENKVSSPGKERVISVLASLADRLESRAHS